METKELDEAIYAKVRQLLPRLCIEVRANNNPAVAEDDAVAHRVIQVARFSTGLGIHRNEPDENVVKQIGCNTEWAMISLVQLMFEVIAPLVNPGEMLTRCPKLRDAIERYSKSEIFDEEYEEFVASLGYERRPVRSSVVVGG